MDITIPAPDFNFSEIAEEKAKQIILKKLNDGRIKLFAEGGYDQLGDYVIEDINALPTKNEKLFCISFLLNHLIHKGIEFKSSLYLKDSSKESFRKGLNKLKYILYSLAENELKYSFDSNTFAEDDIVELDEKIDKIISTLEVLKMGQSILGDEIQEVKDELNSLKSAYVLGKKTFFQKATGIVVSFAGNKGGDIIWEAIMPELKDLLLNEAPKAIEKFLMLNS